MLLAGCARVQTQTYAKQATRDRKFGGIQRVAVFPLDTLSEDASGPKNTENVLIQELLALGTFESVEEPRYVAGLMKKLKLRNTETLDREIVKKIGQELDVDALIVGSLLLNGQEETSTNVEFSIFLRVLEVESGDIIWSGSTFVRSDTTWQEVLGLSEGPSINDLAARGALDMADEIDDQFVDARELEYNILIQDLPPEDDEEQEDDFEDESDEEEEEVEELLLKVAPK
jgi:hypothetical protein